MLADPKPGAAECYGISPAVLIFAIVFAPSFRPGRSRCHKRKRLSAHGYVGHPQLQRAEALALARSLAAKREDRPRGPLPERRKRLAAA